MIGAPGASLGGRGSAGQVYVVFGRASFISSLEPSSLNGSNGFIINGIAMAIMREFQFLEQETLMEMDLMT